MKKRIEQFLESIFSIFVMIAIIGGAVVFALYLIAMILGGESGANLALAVKDSVLPYFIRSAAIAMAAGLISFYLTKMHALSLSIEKEKKEESVSRSS